MTPKTTFTFYPQRANKTGKKARHEWRARWRFIFACACIVTGSFHMASCSGGSGSWDDDVKNWSRAFDGRQQPPDVKVTHSRYWKSPHFTYEAEYFFEFTAPKEFLDAWIAGQNLVPRQPTKENTPQYFEKPDWFTPRALGDYEMWLPEDDPHDKFRIYRDRTTGTLFVTDCST